MSQNYYYPPFPSSGAAQSAYYQSTTSAGPATALSAAAGEYSQEHENQEPQKIPILKGYSDEAVLALVKLKNDPHKYGWKFIYDDLCKRFSEHSFPALNDRMLAGTWNHRDKSTFKTVPTSQQRASAAVPATPVGGSFGISQAVYNTMYAAPQPYPGSSYGAYGPPQSNLGGAFGAAQPGPRSQLSSGGPYASTPGTNPRLPPVAPMEPAWNQSYGYGGHYASAPNTSQQLSPIAPVDPAWTQGYGYGHQYASTPHTAVQLPPLAYFAPAQRQISGYDGQYASPPNTNQRLPPVVSVAPGWDQDHGHGGSHAMTPGMEPESTSDQAGDTGFNDGEFTQEQLQWIFQRGLWYSPGYGWEKITEDYQKAFNKEGVDPHLLKMEFKKMRDPPT
ncbi:hypothetical protein LA080_006177 [Diaporthe eres]|nr:hypothetical protein LA080_006177 [Diaporthe eres]